MRDKEESKAQSHKKRNVLVETLFRIEINTQLLTAYVRSAAVHPEKFSTCLQDAGEKNDLGHQSSDPISSSPAYLYPTGFLSRRPFAHIPGPSPISMTINASFLKVIYH